MKKILLLLIILLLPAQAPAEPTALAAEPMGKLLVFTSEVCIYCKAFMRDVGSVYSRTDAGRALPLTEVDTYDPPENLEDLAWEMRFVPTFLIVDRKGVEMARFRGYRGEESFWGELERVLVQMKKEGN
ncbi:MAG: thioredoxin family protein [Magnetococcales bacterium]|nr:thioredoxin family protein [Magnetococcales bacterium]